MNMNTLTSCRRQRAIVAAAGLAFISLIGMHLTSDETSISLIRRNLLSAEEVIVDDYNTIRHKRRQLGLASGPPPPSNDVADASYIVKPIIGYPRINIYEEDEATLLAPPEVYASNWLVEEEEEVVITEGHPYNVLDGSVDTYWKSDIVEAGVPQWLDIDLGIPELVTKVEIQFTESGSLDFQLQSSTDRIAWTTLETRTGFTGGSVNVTDPYEVGRTDRYLRLYFTGGYTGIDGESPYYAINFVNIWRQAMILRSVHGSNYYNQTTWTIQKTSLEYCGYKGYNSNYDTQVSYVTDVVLGRNANGGLLYLYEAAEYFSVSLSQAQANAMLNDPCVYAVEPNYIIRARGTTTTKHLRVTHQTQNAPEDETDFQEQEENIQQQWHRKLGIPEFNLEDASPGNWGLERISTRGRRNGKYIWVGEGFSTEVYVFDSGIYRDHSEWMGRNVTHNTLGPTRIGASTICAGEPEDNTDHGTLIASIAGGKKYGVAKMAAIHPIQILDVNGEGSIATFLCGMEKLINDGHAFYNANAPKKIKAVVNLSLGVEGKSDILDAAVNDLVGLGYTVVIAAGDNDGGNSCHYSPTTPTAIRVGALKDMGLMTNGTNPKTSTSNYGECIDIWAPGEAIVGASSTGEYDTTIMSGTSVAAAFVTGATSLFLEEFLTSRRSNYRMPQMVKTKMFNRAERGILGDLGHLSVNRMLQTPSSQCQANWHCAPKVCLYDGSCGYQTDTPWNTQQV